MRDNTDGLVKGVIEKFLRRTFAAHFHLVAFVHLLTKYSHAAIHKYFAFDNQLVRAPARCYSLMREVFIDPHWVFVGHVGTIQF